MALIHSRVMLTHASYRPTPLVSGNEGEELRQKVWSEIVEGLKKDVTSVTDVITELEN